MQSLKYLKSFNSLDRFNNLQSLNQLNSVASQSQNNILKFSNNQIVLCLFFFQNYFRRHEGICLGFARAPKPYQKNYSFRRARAWIQITSDEKNASLDSSCFSLNIRCMRSRYILLSLTRHFSKETLLLINSWM